MFNFNFSEKGMGLVSSPLFLYYFSRKFFNMLRCINWHSFIVWLLLLLEILGNICITIVYWPGCDVIEFEINQIFLIKLFYYMTKKSKQKLKYFENEKSFWGAIKDIFHHFKSQIWECAFNKQFWFLKKNSRKGYFQSTTERTNTIVYFFIFDLV